MRTGCGQRWAGAGVRDATSVLLLGRLALVVARNQNTPRRNMPNDPYQVAWVDGFRGAGSRPKVFQRVVAS